MKMDTFISNLNKAWFLTPILLNKTLVVELKPYHHSSQYIEISSRGAKKISVISTNSDFILEGEKNDLEDALFNDGSLKQLIAFEKIKIKGSYRDFLKLEAIIKLS